MTYIIRYGIVSCDEISDRVIVYNPSYGEPIGPWGSRPVSPPNKKRGRLYPFYENLEQSVLEEGFRNPIFCNSIEQGTFCKYGTSRLYVAKKNNLDVPCIIADYTDRWSRLEQLSGEDDIKSKFVDLPQIIEIYSDWMRIDACLA